MEDFAELIKNIISHIVDLDDDIKVIVSGAGRSSIYRVIVNPLDVGRVIGKDGKTISALEHILTRWGGKYQKRIILELDRGTIDPNRKRRVFPVM